MVEGFIRVPFGDIEAIEEAAIHHPDIVAIFGEPIQGEGGVNTAPQGFSYLEEIRQICNQHNWLMMLDEVQTGNGRTGEYFAYQHTNIIPDVLTTAKGLGNGFPVAAVLCKKGLTYKKGMLGTTFGGNHLACAAVKAVCETIAEENLLKNAQIQGEKLKKSLTSLSAIAELRGKGLMLGIALKSGDASSAIAELQKRRIITGSAACKDTLRILPPLSISDEELEFFIQAITQALKQTS